MLYNEGDDTTICVERLHRYVLNISICTQICTQYLSSLSTSYIYYFFKIKEFFFELSTDIIVELGEYKLIKLPFKKCIRRSLENWFAHFPLVGKSPADYFNL